MKERTRKHWEAQGGFTLVEVIAVLILLGVLGAVVASRARQSHAELDGQAAALATHLRYAQTLAMNTGRTWGIRFDEGADRYWLFYCDTPPCGGGDNHAPLPATEMDELYRVNLGQVKVDLASASAGGHAVAALSFDSAGRPYRDSGAALQDPLEKELVIRLVQDAEAKEIRVLPETGYIP